MKHLNEYRARPRMGRALAVAAVLLCVSALSEPNLAYAGPHGGGGGVHGGGGGVSGRGRRVSWGRLPRRRIWWVSRTLREYASWFRRAARWFPQAARWLRHRVRVRLLSLWMGFLSGLQLVLLFRSCRLLPLRTPVQRRLADGSR